MGTMSRTGTARFFIGNTAEEVLRHVDCSVLVLEPPLELDTPAALLADASEARGSARHT
ncbi:MAG: universal stress protein [bacterium]|nr:universal stress protein [bacterium]